MDGLEKGLAKPWSGRNIWKILRRLRQVPPNLKSNLKSRIVMKPVIILLSAGTMAVFCWSMGNAQIIYSNLFDGAAVTLDGTAPTVANSSAGGINSALWTCTFTNGVDGTVLANGTLATNSGCALLPFTPQLGCIYSMTASLTVPAGMGNWVAMGFTQFNTQTNFGGYSRFTDNPPNGYAWMYAQVGNGEVLCGGPKASNQTTSTPTVMSSAGTYTLEITLNTVGARWTVSAFINGIQIGTNIVYSTNPTIAFAGIGQNSSGDPAGVQWNYWSLSVRQAPAVPTNYWAAPVAAGTGSGSSAANAASYLNPSFWSSVQSQLQSENVTVNFQTGAYDAGSLNFTNMGNPLYSLTLAALTPHGAVFSPSANVVQLYGCQNFQLNGLVFNGPTPYWGVYCIPNGSLPCRNIEITNCWFLNLTNAYYGAIGLLNGTRDVRVFGCNFTNITAGDHEHMIYAPHDIEDVVVSNCVFQDCLADYVRFRDDSEYCWVQNCAFISTMSASAWPFVSAELYNVTNSDSAGDEFFGTYFQISSNSFTYEASGGSGPYSALHFSDDGYSPQSYDCDLTSAQASQLSSGSAAFQQTFLQTNMGIIPSGIKMFGNTYNSRVAYHMDYTYEWDGVQPNGGWQGTIGLNNVPDASGTPLGTAPVMRNANFDRRGLLLTPVSQGLDDYECLFRNWLCSPKYTDILLSSNFYGTNNALRFNVADNQYVYQWISSPGPAWTMDCLFAIGSAFTGVGVKFQVDLFHNDVTGGKVSLGVDNLGRFGIYNGGTFMLLPGLGTVAFSVDNTGDGAYTDPGDVLNVYHLRIIGNYAASTPYVSIYTSDANSLNLDHEALGLTDWVGSSPVSGLSAPETAVFYNYTAPVLLGQIAFAQGIPPTIASALVQGNQFILNGINGSPGGAFYVLSTTNIALPLVNWTRESTNTFTGTSFSITNVVPPGLPQKFYSLQLQ